jgi:hypothetical protein
MHDLDVPVERRAQNIANDLLLPEKTLARSSIRTSQRPLGWHAIDVARYANTLTGPSPFTFVSAPKAVSSQPVHFQPCGLLAGAGPSNCMRGHSSVLVEKETNCPDIERLEWTLCAYQASKIPWSTLMRTRIEIRNTHYTFPWAGMAGRRVHLSLDGSFWAGSGLSASVRGSMNSCRLGRSELLAAAANYSDVWKTTLRF